MAKDVCDAVILDNIFQPVADILSPIISSTKLSIFCLDGLLVVDVIFNVLLPVSIWKLKLINLIILLVAFTIVRVILVRNSKRQQYKFVNIARYSFLGMRLASLLLVVFSILDIAFSSVISSILYLLTAYFASCQDRTTRVHLKRFAYQV